jgi:transglycosylase-like protein with SLT domain
MHHHQERGGPGEQPHGRALAVSPLAIILCLVAVMLTAAPARAELAFFSSGRSLSIKSHHMNGDSLVLVLRAGGEIVCQPSLITDITPDEVPYPEPEAAPIAPAAPAATALAPIDALPVNPRYREIIEKVSAEQGVDPKLVRAVIQVESAYRQRARSRKGAMGLMQLMPETARQYGVVDPYDPAANIEAGIKHLKALLEKLPRDLALAAYNAGEAAVQRFRGIPPYPETRAYVASILTLVGR